MRVVACALLLPGAARADGPAGQTACTQQDVRVSAVNRAQLETSLLCLTNSYRAQMGLAPGRARHPPGCRVARPQRGHGRPQLLRPQEPRGSGPGERAARPAIPGGVGENIAYSSRGTIRRPVRGLARQPRPRAEHARPRLRARSGSASPSAGPAAAGSPAASSSAPRPRTPPRPGWRRSTEEGRRRRGLRLGEVRGGAARPEREAKRLPQGALGQQPGDDQAPARADAQGEAALRPGLRDRLTASRAA